MRSLVLLVAVAGLLPFLVGLSRLGRSASGVPPWPRIASILACVLAFNLTFFWQELWLVIPKALTPGLSPVLYHNDHDWTGSAPIAQLLQGTGALATLVSGLASFATLSARRRWSADVRLFLWWMAFEGLFQSLTQFAIGSVLPGNDVGRALTYLGANAADKAALCGASILAMACAGAGLAAHWTSGLGAPRSRGTRASAWALLASAIACVVLSVPYRAPRELVEVVMIPALVNLIGIGWVVFGAGVSRGPDVIEDVPGVARLLLALAALLVLFQFALRPGIRF